jgi:hypothetical protein
VLQADPNAPVGDILGAGVVKANPFLAGMTAQDLQAWAARKVGGSGPQVASASVSPASPPSAPLQAIPQQSAPIFAQQQIPQPMQQNPQPAQGGGSLFGQMPAEQAMQAPPIFYAPRRSPDLSKLRAAFKPPVFGQG